MAKQNVKKAAGKTGKKTKAVGSRKSPSKFFREMSSELKKVSWPTRKELTTYTIAVMVLVLIFGVIIGVIDLGLSRVIELIIR
jgi:preprotein translocase subunit SecE